MAGVRIDLLGKVFGRLTVQKLASSVPKSGQSQWVCLCECGTLCTVRATLLRRGHTKSCGCYRQQRLSITRSTHGMTKTPEYIAWQEIRKCCYNPNVRLYPKLGGAGIVMCDRWKESFPQFLEDVGRRPEGPHMLKRLDKTRNYEPGNLAWVRKNPPRPKTTRLRKPPQQAELQREPAVVVPKVPYRPPYLQQRNTWFPSATA